MGTFEADREAAVLRAAHTAVRDLLRPEMPRYWLDFGASYVLAGSAFAGAALTEPWNPWSWALVVLSGLALYRCVVFLHEVVHFLGRRCFARFRLAWNALVGVPLLIPVFMYECHGEHHNWRTYGTAQDAEYVPLARLSRWRVVGIVVAVPLLPLYGVFRFGVLTPPSWLLPALREQVWRRSSALKLDVDYEGVPPATPAQARRWLVQEVASVGVLTTVVVLAASGVLPLAVLVQLYLTVLVVVCLNTFRLLVAHRYLGDEATMTVLEQVGDTYNHPRNPWLGELWAPVGLRLHALHHLMPGLPYHAYAEAHDRLGAALPADSVYHRTSSPGPWSSLRALWRTAGRRHELGGLSAGEARHLVTDSSESVS